MVRGGIFNIGGRPRVIVVIAGTDREVLIGQLNLVRGYADIVELRLDLSMGLDLEWWSRVVRERGLVWMLTLRSCGEGGGWSGCSGEYARVITSALKYHPEYIDVEYMHFSINIINDIKKDLPPSKIILSVHELQQDSGKLVGLLDLVGLAERYSCFGVKIVVCGIERYLGLVAEYVRIRGITTGGGVTIGIPRGGVVAGAGGGGSNGGVASITTGGGGIKIIILATGSVDLAILSRVLAYRFGFWGAFWSSWVAGSGDEDRFGAIGFSRGDGRAVNGGVTTGGVDASGERLLGFLPEYWQVKRRYDLDSVDSGLQLCCLLGGDVSQSWGDIWHNRWRGRGDERYYIYIKIPVGVQELRPVIGLLFDLQFIGISVTAPYKTVICRHLRELGLLRGAVDGIAAGGTGGGVAVMGVAGGDLPVNTLLYGKGGYWVKNTDSEALLHLVKASLKRAGMGLLNTKRVLILGAGDTAVSSILAFLELGFRRFTLVNRSLERAKVVKYWLEKLSTLSIQVDLQMRGSYAVVINTVPLVGVVNKCQAHAWGWVNNHGVADLKHTIVGINNGLKFRCQQDWGGSAYIGYFAGVGYGFCGGCDIRGGWRISPRLGGGWVSMVFTSVSWVLSFIGGVNSGNWLFGLSGIEPVMVIDWVERSGGGIWGHWNFACNWKSYNNYLINNDDGCSRLGLGRGIVYLSADQLFVQQANFQLRDWSCVTKVKD